MKAAMRPQDNIISAYRVHGWTYLMGIPAAGVLCELTGKPFHFRFLRKIEMYFLPNKFVSILK